MLQQLLQNKKLRSKINSFFSQHKDALTDIILFGSLVRGKEKPVDIDILLLFATKEDMDIAYAFRKALEPFSLPFNVITKTYSSLLSGSFAAKEAILAEGYSLITNTTLATSFGYSPFLLFRYTLQGFTQSQRMLFQYSLHGRYNKEGMIQKLHLIKFSDSILLAPISSAEETKEYLSLWHISFEEIPVLFPRRIFRESSR